MAAPRLPPPQVSENLKSYEAVERGAVASRCGAAYPFFGAVGRQMAAAADFGPGSWLWPAFAGAPPAPRIPHTEGRCLCGMQGAGSVRGTTGIWQLPRAKRARWAPSHTHTTLQVIRARPSSCE